MNVSPIEYIFSNKILNNIPKFPFVQSVPIIQHWNDTANLYRLILNVISECKFHTSEWHTLIVCMGKELDSQIFLWSKTTIG